MRDIARTIPRRALAGCSVTTPAAAALATKPEPPRTLPASNAPKARPPLSTAIQIPLRTPSRRRPELAASARWMSGSIEKGKSWVAA